MEICPDAAYLEVAGQTAGEPVLESIELL